jgi:DNA-binding response OmpR family regulator
MARILLIEDEKPMRDAIEKILIRAGHEARTAINGREGLASIPGAPPDLVITDIFMPEKDGIETIVALRNALKDVKIIAMSGGGRASNFDFLQLAGKIGADAVLKKPLRMADLLACIDRLLKTAPPAAAG